MEINDGDFQDLRAKLDVMGFKQALPVLAVPLVGAIFGDLIRTTECLRDTKTSLAELLEEKTCWEMGVEPYKCDNARLLAECNELHLQFVKEREDFELRLCDAERRLRSLQTDKEHLQSHNAQLQNQLDAFLSKQLFTATNAKRSQLGTARSTKKPFVSTVRSGDVLPPVLGNFAQSTLKCTKCNVGVVQKTTTTNKDGVTVTHTSAPEEVDRLQNELTACTDQLEFYKRKVESRNREIRRLNDLLMGGRPPAALAKDCCYKEVGALSQDIDLLQREKTDLMSQMRECQDKMHDAMQRALRTEDEKQRLQLQLNELKEAALEMEQQANSELDARELEVQQLQVELKQLKGKAPPLTGHEDKRKLHEKLNVLSRRAEELELLNEKQKKKLLKMHTKMCELQKEVRDQSSATPDEEKIKLRSERDFFQKEYLRLMAKSGSDTEIAFLQQQIKSKDEELRLLRSELCMQSARKSDIFDQQTPSTACSTNSNRSECVQAAIQRVERERDCARAEMERMRCERDILREKQLSSVQLHAEELQSLRTRNEELMDRLRQLEQDMRAVNGARYPTEAQNAILKEDLAVLKERIATQLEEIEKLKRENSQITLLNDQNERIVADYQSKLLIADRQRQAADARASTIDSGRESNRNEVSQLRTELGALRQTLKSLEHEKDTLMNQLDNKTERLYKLEYENKDCKEQRNSLEQTVKELESQISKLTSRTRQRDSELCETSAESKTLRQQIVALKASRDEAIAEHRHLTDKLSDAQVDVKTMQTKLRDSEQQVINMKQQLHKYVQEVKKAEDLLMNKEKEREELLDYYHNLTHDQVELEGNNRSLEIEAEEFKRQICDLECEVRSLKDQLLCRQCTIDDLEMQLTATRASMRCLQRELENARDHKIELDVRKELCDKLDVEKEKLNAELNEMNEIRKKLEKECEKLRSELQQKSMLNQLTTETTEQMLERIRGEKQRQDEDELRSKCEMDRLRQLHESTLNELQEERARCNQQERLANEYEQQARELRQGLSEDRFCQARSRDLSSKTPPKTL